MLSIWTALKSLFLKSLTVKINNDKIITNACSCYKHCFTLYPAFKHPKGEGFEKTLRKGEKL